MPPEWKEKIYARKISMNHALKLFSDAQERRKIELEHIVFTEGMKALEVFKILIDTLPFTLTLSNCKG